MRDASGVELGRTSESFGAGQHRARFLEELPLTVPATGRLSTVVRISNIEGLILDSAGNLIFTSTNDFTRVRKFDLATNTLSTIAGNGRSGLSGDGGPATEASLNYPRGIALDPAGNLFIADFNNRTIRKVNLAATPNNSATACAPSARQLGDFRKDASRGSRVAS